MSQTTIIIGGGAVGLNIALAFAESKRGGEIYLIEKEPYLGHHTTGRNSEVVHAGLAYPPGSLKSQLCVEGNRLTYELCERIKAPVKQTGKWVLAINDAEAEGLIALAANAKEGGSVGLEPRTPQEAVGDVPELALPKGAMFSPSTGMIDAASYVRALDRVLSSFDDVSLIAPCRVTGVDTAQSTLITNRGEMPYDRLINSAGLWADEVYRMTNGPRSFQVVPFKGEYYRWKNGTLNHVIYPVPKRFVTGATKGDATLVSSLGIHAHRNVAGDLMLGPSQVKLEPTQKDDYTIVSGPELFAHGITPFVKKPPTVDDLEQGYAGNRPKIFEDGKPVGDFLIFEEGNIIHLLGIESPGLTAAPAIARKVLGLLRS